MSKTYFGFVAGLVLISWICQGQQTINGSILHDDLEREYILYIPASYSGTSQVPLVLNFHGYGSSASEQMIYGDFRAVADTAGFLVVHPQGTVYSGSTHWNVGGWTGGSTVDDVGFTEALIDSLSADYTIDADRIYATGMSNGGFMSFLLAGELSEKIASIGSVTGSMTPETFINSDPQHPMPIVQIHGTFDFIVPYNGAPWSKSIGDVLAYWTDFNNCVPEPVITQLPDLDPDDGSTVELYEYPGGDNGVSVVHYKVSQGGHSWPGSSISVPLTNYDINASSEIWNFFYKYNINGLNGITGAYQAVANPRELSMYPNPAKDKVMITSQSELKSLQFFNHQGQLLTEAKISGYQIEINISEYKAGIYFMRIRCHDQTITRKLMLE